MPTDHPRHSHPAPRPPTLPLALLSVVLLTLAWSAYRPFGYGIWALEVFPAILGIIILLATYRRFPLTPLAYWLAAIHCVILIIGGHYTYANVPIGNWFKEAFDLSRNHYDRLGHFAQGFVPAIIAREVLLRRSPLGMTMPNGTLARKWLFFLVLCVCLAISGVYELIEWAVAEIDSQGSQEFLGTQGDVWDTQKDIALCGLGAIAALLTLSKWHDGQIERERDEVPKRVLRTAIETK